MTMAATAPSVKWSSVSRSQRVSERMFDNFNTFGFHLLTRGSVTLAECAIPWTYG